MSRTETDDTEITALPASEHSLGDDKAALTLVEYGDYECPACAQAAPLVQHLADTLGNHMRFVYRHFPLVEIHPNAEVAAEAAEAAAAQGQFWPMHRLLFAHANRLETKALAGYAEQLGLDMLRFNTEMADRIYLQRVQEHRRAGTESGLRATPAFFLNDAPIDVSFGFDRLEAAVHSALARQPQVG